jgi:iron complex outermembrane recepter protein
VRSTACINLELTKMSWKKSLIATAVAAACVPAHAEDEPKQLGKIRVEADEPEEGLKAETQSTSSKMELSLRETPQSVTVITADSLKDRQVKDLGQALELAAGVTQFSGTGPFAGQAGFGFNATTIRGIPIDDVNDVRDDGFINTTYFAIPDMAIYDRIEVIKGPNSVAYGRGSAGGLINRIRKKPRAERVADFELNVGAFDTYRADVDLAGALNSSGSVTGRLVGAYADEGSFVDGVELQRTVLAPSLAFDVTDTTRVMFEGLYQHDSFVPNTGMPLRDDGDGHYVAPDIRRSLYLGVPTQAKTPWDIRAATVQVEQQLGDTWLASLRLNKNNTDSPIRTDNYAYGLSDTGDTFLSASKFSINRDTWAAELRFSGDVNVGDVPVKVAAGVELSDNDYHRSGQYANLGYANIYDENFDLPAQPYTPGFEYTTHDRAKGTYLQAQVKPTERLGILLGLRYDQTDAEYHNVTGDELSRKKDEDVSGKIGVTWEFNDNVSGYVVYAQSFSPVLFDVDQDGNILEPETGLIYEVGAKTEWFDRKLGVNAAIYRIDRDHIPVGAPVPPGDPPYSVSSGLQRSEGFEIEINGQPVPGWNISAAYNNVDSEFKDPLDRFFGQRPGGSADWQLGLYSSYELQGGPLKGLGFGATVFSIGERGLSPFELGSLKGYDRVDLNIFYNGLDKYEFALSMRNVLDERYVEGADRSGAIAMFGSPPAWLLTIRRHFGQ